MGADLITLEEYKTLIQIEGTKDDAKLSSLISSVSQLVKTYCGNSFVDYVTSDKTEIISPIWSNTIIQTTESPIISITSVEERTTYNEDYATLLEVDYEFFVDYTTDTIYRTSSAGFINWATGPGAIKIVYKAGYSDLPEDLKLAIYDLITYYHKQEYKERKTIGTVSIANQTTSTQWRNVSFPDHIKRVLDLYKQVSI
jgi:hypothetical protein